MQAEHNHPALHYTDQECIDIYAGNSPGYMENIVPDTNTDVTTDQQTLHVAFLSGETYFFFACEPGT